MFLNCSCHKDVNKSAVRTLWAGASLCPFLSVSFCLWFSRVKRKGQLHRLFSLLQTAAASHICTLASSSSSSSSSSESEEVSSLDCFFFLVSGSLPSPSFMVPSSLLCSPSPILDLSSGALFLFLSDSAESLQMKVAGVRVSCILGNRKGCVCVTLHPRHVSFKRWPYSLQYLKSVCTYMSLPEPCSWSRSSFSLLGFLPLLFGPSPPDQETNHTGTLIYPGWSMLSYIYKCREYLVWCVFTSIHPWLEQMRTTEEDYLSD